MTSILKNKVNKKYSIGNLEKILPEKAFFYFASDESLEIPALYNISNYIDLNYIKYTVKDFKKDYPLYSKYKEIDSVFNIFKQGYSLKKFFIKKEIYSVFSKNLKNGFFYNSKVANLKNAINDFIIKYDISNFKIEFYKEHVELYGDKELLRAFKNSFNLQEDIYYEKYKNSWHLAFSGLLADYIICKEKKG
ncbi:MULTISPECIES: hypothetical protein [Fusobacterium]|uniref:hypothetical protein n=1 Tax=Fusobacterium TaxID=848 RepID=UPI000E47BF5D|nr:MULTISPECIES: hypothetical protein [Fusobacterium]RGY64490.1 hypothetical protein DXA30_07945 [Fusobacterium ulcerans]